MSLVVSSNTPNSSGCSTIGLTLEVLHLVPFTTTTDLHNGVHYGKTYRTWNGVHHDSQQI